VVCLPVMAVHAAFLRFLCVASMRPVAQTAEVVAGAAQS